MRETAIEHPLTDGQAAGLKSRPRANHLMDTRDLSGARLRLWDVGQAAGQGIDDTAKAAISQKLLTRFAEVQWVTRPSVGVVWLTVASLEQLPELSQGWESSPIGVWVWGDLPGWKAQAKLDQLFEGFCATHYLGNIKMKRSSFLLNLRRWGSRAQDSEREIALFEKLWSLFLQKNWSVVPRREHA